MTSPIPQKEYIITGEELERACSQMSACGYGVSANYIDAMVKSRPYTSAEQVFDRLSEVAHKKFGEYKDVVNGFDFFVEDLLAELLELREEARR